METDFPPVILSHMDKQVLFICTGNYYRSRYAEMFFNHLASKMKINWQAVSRGILVDEGHNIGSIATCVLEQLELHGVFIGEQTRLPLQLEEKNLLEADLTIALNRVEHQLMMKKRFTTWTEHITYWDVPDLNVMESKNAFAAIERNIYSLLEDLQAESH
jgi:protein-tyrosine phosphatase